MWDKLLADFFPETSALFKFKSNINRNYALFSALDPLLKILLKVIVESLNVLEIIHEGYECILDGIATKPNMGYTQSISPQPERRNERNRPKNFHRVLV